MSDRERRELEALMREVEIARRIYQLFDWRDGADNALERAKRAHALLKKEMMEESKEP